MKVTRQELSGTYYSFGTTGAVPWAYDIVRAYEGMKGRKIKMN
jgi:hypothetical protein